jgi:hypothetical protein
MSFSNQSEIEAVVEGFESCETPADAFTHRHHLVVATWYLHNNTEEEALKKMKSGLIKFLTFHGEGIAKYNETMTLFWLKMVRRVEQQLGPHLSLVEMTNRVAEALANSRLIFDYYSEVRVKATEAKANWVEPDLKDIEEGNRR